MRLCGQGLSVLAGANEDSQVRMGYSRDSRLP